MKMRYLSKRPWVHLWEWILSVPIRIKIMGIALGLVLALGMAFLFWMRMTLTRTLKQQLEQRVISLGRDVAARSTDLVLTNDLMNIYRLLQDTVDNNPEVRYAFVEDRDGKVLVHTFGAAFPTDLLTIHDHESEQSPGGQLYHIEEINTEEGRIHDIAMPIFGGRAGTVRLGITEHQLRQTVSQASHELILITIVASLLGIGAAFLLTITLTRPILELAETTRALSKGDFEHHVKVLVDDEIGQLGSAFNTMIEKLDTNRRMQARLLQRLISAQEEERKRIARELHDQTSQSLTSLMVGLKVLEGAVTSGKVQSQVQDLRRLTGQILQELHSLSANLRPNVLDDLGLMVALQQYVQQSAKRFGLAVDFQVAGMENIRLTSDVEIALYRIVQEALSNVAKHSYAQNASVLMECRDDMLVVIVEDDGVGFDPAAVMQSEIRDKLGLFGMQERAAFIGGKLTIESQPAHGTTLFVEVPLSDEVLSS